MIFVQFVSLLDQEILKIPKLLHLTVKRCSTTKQDRVRLHSVLKGTVKQNIYLILSACK